MQRHSTVVQVINARENIGTGKFKTGAHAENEHNIKSKCLEETGIRVDMEADTGERSSFVIGLIENRAKEVSLFISQSPILYICFCVFESIDIYVCT